MTSDHGQTAQTFASIGLHSRRSLDFVDGHRIVPAHLLASAGEQELGFSV